ncbi:hypothetical protein D918_00027 [Trichuris suis]|nr:hypothetical protein D918_00027 [Trichuris suis]
MSPYRAGALLPAEEPSWKLAKASWRFFLTAKGRTLVLRAQLVFSRRQFRPFPLPPLINSCDVAIGQKREKAVTCFHPCHGNSKLARAAWKMLAPGEKSTADQAPAPEADDYKNAVVTASTTASPKPFSDGTAKSRSPNDYVFIRSVGEGSFSSVFAGIEAATGRECAIKVCEKQLIRRERKVPYVMREKDAMTILNRHPHPFVVRLFCTFQDEGRLCKYCVLIARFSFWHQTNGRILKPCQSTITL